MPGRAAISRLAAEGGLVQRSNGTFIVPQGRAPRSRTDGLMQKDFDEQIFRQARSGIGWKFTI
jgi:hypothetical protein